MLELPDDITVRKCRDYWLAEHEVYGVKAQSSKRDEAVAEVVRLTVADDIMPPYVHVTYDREGKYFVMTVDIYPGLTYHAHTVQNALDRMKADCMFSGRPDYVQWIVYAPETSRFIAIHGTFTCVFATGKTVKEAVQNMIEKCSVSTELGQAVSSYVGTPEVPAATVAAAIEADRAAFVAFVNDTLAANTAATISDEPAAKTDAGSLTEELPQ